MVYKFSALFAAFGFVLTGCQTTKNMEFSEWHSVNAEEADLNISEVSPIKIASISHQTRDNDIRNSKYLFDKKIGFLHAQRSMSSYFGHSTLREFDSEDVLLSFINTLGPSFKTDQQTLKTVKHKRVKSSGYLVYGQETNTDKDCVFAVSTYRFKERGFDNDWGGTDTFVNFVYCNDDARSKDFMSMLQNIEIQ